MITLQKKQALVSSAKQRQKLDEYQKGICFEKVSAVGCVIADINELENLNIDYNDHETLAEYLGIPIFLTKMQDNVFDCCTDDYRKNWPIKFLEAIPTDRTISDLIVPKFLLFILKDIDCPDVKDVLTNWIETGKPDKEATTTKVAEAARAALYATSVDATRAALHAARAALHAADVATNKAKAYDLYGDEILRLMRETI